jgi:hypothetical protein
MATTINAMRTPAARSLGDRKAGNITTFHAMAVANRVNAPLLATGAIVAGQPPGSHVENR